MKKATLTPLGKQVVGSAAVLQLIRLSSLTVRLESLTYDLVRKSSQKRQGVLQEMRANGAPNGSWTLATTFSFCHFLSSRL
jgi:hypothetical protein